MDRPPPDPSKLLEAWMEWERGETTPGRVMSTMKTGGLRDLLEEMAAAQVSAVGNTEEHDDEEDPSAESWTPVV